MRYCNPIFYISGASVASNVVTLTVNGSPAVSNGLVYALAFAPNVQVPAGVLGTDAVQLSVGGNAYPLWDKFGNPMTFSELATTVCPCTGSSIFRPRKLICVGVGTVSGASHFIAFNLPLPTPYGYGV